MSHIEKKHSPPARFHIMDLFAGPGGLDVAADVLGYQVTGIEWDGDACATREAAGLDTFQGDVRHYRAAFFPHAQVLTGGPPCQTFTVAGHGAGRRALDKVVEYIDRLHDVVRENGDDWEKIFRTWRKIYQELRVKEIEAKQLRTEKRGLEEYRTAERKAFKKKLAQLGNSPAEIKSLLKTLGAPQDFDGFPDDEIKPLVERLGDLDNQIDKLKGRLEELGDERTGLVLQPLWWVIERSKRPGSEPYEAVILEQVPAVMPVWKEYADVLETLGYRTGRQMMHTEEFGVPQTRRRAVLMARLDQGTPANKRRPLPAVPETHDRYRPGGGFREPLPRTDEDAPEAWVSMEKALAAAGLPTRPPFTVVSNYGTGGVPEARGRRDHDVPSATITGKVSRNRVVHKGTDKDLDAPLGRFSPAEAGVLQTFPVAYPWSGKDVSQQIGNAVPPRLALHVLRQVLEPGLSEKEAGERLEEAVARLRTWKPVGPVKVRKHNDLKGHPLTGR
ncbi:DNA cytosine methyltransferase [Streptomyces sp. NPDC048201]|uniref:DNA cytosine methyltransferase n=1 Tax=Streptomyces sp. NPDC048201 TaxID=3365513 RepID=UPI003720F150